MAVLGPTASGKTDLAIEIARRLDGEIISVDSMQVYRGMDVGTAKPTIFERRGVPHHMVDIVDPETDYSVAEFRQTAREIIETSQRPLIICGGSGLHFRALVDPMNFAPTEPELRASLESEELSELVEWLTGHDENAASVVDLQNKRRVVRAVEVFRLTGQTPTQRAASAEANEVSRYVSEIEFRAVGVDPGTELDQRIGLRLQAMRSGGLVEEVGGLRGRLGRTSATAVGYREILEHLDGVMTEDEAFETIERNTRKLAKKQRTWFQRDPRIRWIPWDDDGARVTRAIEVLT